MYPLMAPHWEMPFFPVNLRKHCYSTLQQNVSLRENFRIFPGFESNLRKCPDLSDYTTLWRENALLLCPSFPPHPRVSLSLLRCCCRTSSLDLGTGGQHILGMEMFTVWSKVPNTRGCEFWWLVTSWKETCDCLSCTCVVSLWKLKVPHELGTDFAEGWHIKSADVLNGQCAWVDGAHRNKECLVYRGALVNWVTLASERIELWTNLAAPKSPAHCNYHQRWCTKL